MAEDFSSQEGLEAIRLDPNYPQEADKKGFAEDASYDPNDRRDNYNLRKAFKEEIIGRRQPIVTWTLRIIVAFFVLFFLFAVAFLISIWGESDKLQSVVSNTLTHGMILIVGVLLKSLFPPLPPNANGRGR